MTTRPNKTTPAGFRLPDPPRREPDEVTSIKYLHGPGTTNYLAIHFGNRESTLVKADRWIINVPEDNLAEARRPDLLITFGVSPEKYEENNGYVSSEQGKPPDFVLEVASESTAATDTGAKRDDYAALGIYEYWRFDHTGEHHGAKLAGDRLVDDRYEAIFIESAGEDIEQGYSDALNLYLRWDHGQLVFIDPATNAPILTYEDQAAKAESEKARAESEKAKARARNEATLRQQAEQRVRQLEEEIRRLRGE